MALFFTLTVAYLIGSRYPRLGAPGTLFATAQMRKRDLLICGQGFGKIIRRHTDMMETVHVAPT